MKNYRIFKFGSDGYLQNGWDFKADDDAQAEDIGALHLDDCTRVEVWQGTRQICDLRGML